MAELWGNINFRTIHRALKKIGFTRKKRPMDIKKEMKFKEIIATKDPKSLVFLDESGINNTEDYAYGYCQKALKSGKKSQV